MIETSTIILCVITLILLKIFLNIKLGKLKDLNKRKSEELEKIANKFPESNKICEDILNSLDNKNVEIKIEPEYGSCLYTVFNNTITIGKFNQDYMKTQTIAHECIHSIQNKTTLWSNFIVTNIYLIYFVVVLILAFFNKLQYSSVHILTLLFLSIIQYIVRNGLEVDAMTRAKYIAKEYIEKKKLLNEDEEEKLLKEYDEVNSIGIPFMSYYLILSDIVKIVFFCIAVLV